MTWIRVQDKDTHHEFDVNELAFVEATMTKVNDQERFPDLVEDNDRPRPPVYRTAKAGSPASSKKGSES